MTYNPNMKCKRETVSTIHNGKNATASTRGAVITLGDEDELSHDPMDLDAVEDEETPTRRSSQRPRIIPARFRESITGSGGQNSRASSKRIKPTQPVYQSPERGETPLKAPNIPRSIDTRDDNAEEVQPTVCDSTATPTRPESTKPESTPSKLPLSLNNFTTDRSARRKSARRLFVMPTTTHGSDSEPEQEVALARRILAGDASASASASASSSNASREPSPAPTTPSKRPFTAGPARRRTRRKRTPTPPRDLPAHEQYFFQNRAGGPMTSSHTLAGVALLSHEQFYEKSRACPDPHAAELRFLHELHGRSFGQWAFELRCGFSVCLYGWGSKRGLITAFADYVKEHDRAGSIVIVNGYNGALTLREVLTTLARTIPALSSPTTKLPAQPTDLVTAILDALTATPPSPPMYLLISSLDAPPLRKLATQAILARLAAHPSMHLLATADTPNFPLLWDVSLRAQFAWVFHDATTFAPLRAEVAHASQGGAVDAVNALLGRSGRSVEGRGGVAYVLRSLPENARRLFQLLLAELLAAAASEEAGENEGIKGDDADAGAEFEAAVGRGANGVAVTKAQSLGGIEYRTLYHKAVQEFIATNEMAFRTLLKEFYDHQMVVGRRDTGGAEVLSVPFRREECEMILEDLVLE